MFLWVTRTVARIYRRGVTWMSNVYVYMYKACKTRGVWGYAPQEIRCSEIASEAILGPKQSRSRYVAREYCIHFWLSTYAFGMPADFEFPREKVLKVDRTAGGVTSPKGQLVNSRVPEIAIYLRTHLRARPFIAVA